MEKKPKKLKEIAELFYNRKKGWKAIKNKHPQDVTIEGLKDYLSTIFFNRMEELEDRTIMLFQGCKKYGTTKRSAWDSGLCDDPECVSCRDYEKILNETWKESSLKFIDKDEIQKE